MPRPRILILTSALLLMMGLAPTVAAKSTATEPAVRLSLVGQLKDDLPKLNLGDMSFWGDRLVVGYGATEPSGGFVLVDIADPTRPQVLSSMRCQGSSNDVSLYGDLVLVSVDSNRGGPARCGGDGPLMGGLRIFSVADPARPVEVRDIIPTCAGAHTHTAVPDLDHETPDGTADPRLLVYLTNFACEPGDSALPGDSVQVVGVPLTHPGDAAHVDSDISIRGGDEDACHDITVFAPRKLALAACSLQPAEVWDISDPARPRVLSYLDESTPEADKPHISNINMSHSAAFSLDGKVLAVGEESGAGAVNACNTVPDRRGEIRFYDLRDPENPVYRGAYKIPRVVPHAQACTAHYFSPVHSQDGRRLFVSGWYGGGVTLIDATDPARPHELAHHAELDSNAYAAYEYNGFVYVSNLELATAPTVASAGGGRGLEVLRLDGVRTRTLDQLDPQVQKVSSGKPPHSDD